MGKVTVMYGNTIHTMGPRLLTTTDALHSVHSHDTVVIKPNLVVSRRDWRDVDTEPQVVEARFKIRI